MSSCGFVIIYKDYGGYPGFKRFKYFYYEKIY